jgi:hypothetical protein
MEENMSKLPTRKLQVFLCYASIDESAVHKLYEHLCKAGVDVWLDKEKLLPGHDRQLEIERAVKNADVVIICLSTKSLKAEGYVQKQINIALDSAKEKSEGTIFIIPARLEHCVIPERLKVYQQEDLFVDDNYHKLLASLRERARTNDRKLPSLPGREKLNRETSSPDLPSVNRRPNQISKTPKNFTCSIKFIITLSIIFVLFISFSYFSDGMRYLYLPFIYTSTLTPTPTETVIPTDTPNPIPMPLVIVDTDILVGWIPDFDFSKGDSAKNKINTDKVAIKLSYDVGENGYVTMTKSVNAKTMSDVVGISFTYMGDGAPNTIEFKLMLRYPGDSGDTTYGKLWGRATDTGGEWLTFEVPYDDMECWWPDDNCKAHQKLDPAMVDRLDFAISNKAGDEAGSGWVMFKDVIGINP